ncbi:hypothetical protein [Variovorax rhizosphaerae]|uniref:DUF4148 domain-containing protein n=1 Tax=Variovorax rhizosphaerae TaxID=1836200 RepID=A0ABU8WS16_9BURK
MEHAAISFFRTPLLAAVSLPFLCAALPGPAGLIEPPPVEGSPAYLAIQHSHDAFSTHFHVSLSDAEEALARIQQANQPITPAF